MIIKVKDVQYCVEEEDAELLIEDFDTEDEYYEAVKKKIKEIKDCLPDRLAVEVDENDLYAIADAISEETGWLVESFNLDEEDNYENINGRNL